MSGVAGINIRLPLARTFHSLPGNVMIMYDLDPRDHNAQILSGPEGSSNTDVVGVVSGRLV